MVLFIVRSYSAIGLSVVGKDRNNSAIFENIISKLVALVSKGFKGALEKRRCSAFFTCFYEFVDARKLDEKRRRNLVAEKRGGK